MSAEWDGILREGEEILWQGRPRPGIRARDFMTREFLAGLVTLVFVGVWLSLAFQGGMSLFFLLIGLVFAATGLWQAAAPVLRTPWRRRRTFYTLTNRAAYIAVDGWPSRSLETYEITRDMRIDLRPGASDGSVMFGEKIVGSGKRRHRVAVGFEHIDDAQEVFRLMSQARGEAPPKTVPGSPVIRI